MDLCERKDVDERQYLDCGDDCGHRAASLPHRKVWNYYIGVCCDRSLMPWYSLRADVLIGIKMVCGSQ